MMAVDQIPVSIDHDHTVNAYYHVVVYCSSIVLNDFKSDAYGKLSTEPLS